MVSLIFVTVFSIASEAQSSRYTPDEKNPGTHWLYSEWFENGALNQCHVQMETQAINGSHSTITISVLSKGSLVLAINVDDWKNQINLTWGWSVGDSFNLGPPRIVL